MTPLPPLNRLWTFHGGLHLDYRKDLSNREPVSHAGLPDHLVLPLQQHIGSPAKALVQPGDRVLKGQPLGRADGYVSAFLHAPTSGTITALGERPVAHPSGLSAPCLVLEPDGEDRWGEPLPPMPDYRAVDPAEIRHRVRDAGIVGLGGAAFPASVKLNPGPNTRIQLLILNGAECEPYITCDDLLMRNKALEIVKGMLIIRHALQAQDAIIGVEDNKPQAIAALQRALAETGAAGVRVQPVPTLYPTGGEKQLIKVLTGREVPSHGLPAELGIVCHNVGTAAAVYAAVIEGRPLVCRYITVTGHGVARPQVLEALIGTPVAHLIDRCGGYTDQVRRLIMGGPMMGFALSSDEVPMVKGSNCILAATDADIAPPRPPLPCIRCGACVDACPADLLPQQLYWHAKAREFDKTQDYNLFDCIECGCCAQVCPSHIPLVQYFRFAKTEIWTQERERQKADLARQRFEARQARQEREQQEKAAKLAQRKKALNPSTPAGDDPKKAAIQAALERAKAKTAGIEEAAAPPADAAPPPAKPKREPSPEQLRKIEEAKARKAAKAAAEPKD